MTPATALAFAITEANLTCRRIEAEADRIEAGPEGEHKLDRFVRILGYATRTYPGSRHGTVSADHTPAVWPLR